MNNINESREVVRLLKAIAEKVTDDCDVAWTRYKTIAELRRHIDDCISRVEQGDKDVLIDIYVDFGPTSTFQELSIQNNWSDEYLRLASQFDKIYERNR